MSDIGFFVVEKMRVTSDAVFIVCTLTDNSYEPISVRNCGSYCKTWYLFVK